MSYIRYDERGNGMADGGSAVSSIEGLKRAIIESYGLVGMSVVVEMSYWLGEHGSCAIGEREVPIQISNDKDFEFFTSAHEIILMRVAEIEAVYAANGLGMREVDGTACEVQNKVDKTEDAALEEAEDDDDEDYGFNLWHDFVGRNCEWDDDKDEDGGVGSGSSTNKQRTANPPSTFEDYVDEGRYYIGSYRYSMENTEEENNNSGVKSSDQVPDTKNHSDPNQEEDPSVDSSSQILVLVTPPKPFNMHTREVDDSDDFVGQVPQCVSSRPRHDTSDGEDEEDDFEEPVSKCVSVGQTHETPDGEDEDDDFVEPVPQCVPGGQTHETLVGEDEDDDFIKPVTQSRSREEDARRRREKDKADDESLMKSVRAVELYGFEDVEPSSNNGD
ncbi:hypothetical protein Bca101_010769 [Brassica carinata]